MRIKKAELEKMNEMLEQGATFAQIQRKFKNYDYWEIYWAANDYSFLGKKRMITNRINKIATSKSPSKRRKIAKETKKFLNELYAQMNYPAAELRGIRIMRNPQIISTVRGGSVYRFFFGL